MTRLPDARGGVLALLIVAASACAPQVSAQAPHAHGATRPTVQECRVLANKLGSNPRSEAFRQALRSNLAACGNVGAEALANALGAAKSVEEPGFAGSFRFLVAYNRSPIVLDALLAVAEDRTAAPAMRIMAIEGVLRQHALESGFSEGPEELSARPMGRLCRIVLIEHAGDYKSATALPPGSGQASATRLRRIADDAGTPQGVRDAAKCTAERLV